MGRGPQDSRGAHARSNCCSNVLRKPLPGASVNAAFPPLVFLQLLFGYRDLDELRHAFPDVRARDETVPLLRALFPSRRSLVLPIQ